MNGIPLVDLLLTHVSQFERPSAPRKKNDVRRPKDMQPRPVSDQSIAKHRAICLS